MTRWSLPLAALLAATGVARADDSVATYALVVGSNVGGPGQTELRYAEDDARKFGALLVDLGGVGPAAVDVVLHPTPAVLRDHIASLAARVRADVGAGRQARVYFYYSGHARASAIDLGASELALDELRERLFAVPATLTVVVLDACQSGAFSHVKGAQPAADFSFSSRQHLDASGVAVLASSSGSELSQESPELRGSYFTHHLLVGLRGAGDSNGDGQVTIDEAYRYAYHQTLLATTATAVGGQHVTFEADLKGHGDVALSFPRAATSAIVLPAALEGQALVEDKRARVVVAELYKAKGAAVRLAVVPGDYEVLVRHGGVLARCDVGPGGELDLARCRREAIVATVAKGGGFVRPTRVSVIGVAGPERRDGYTDNLAAFGYDEDFLAVSAGVEVIALRQLARHLFVGGLASFVQMPRWSHRVVGSNLDQTLRWTTTTLAAVVRGEQPFADAGWLARVALYGHAAAGLGVGYTRLTGADRMDYRDYHVGPAFELAGGLSFAGGLVDGLVLDAGYAFAYAPVIGDLVGNTHASGGHRATLAIGYRF